MKTSIRSTRFTMGMVLFLVIILLLSISSAYFLNRLSGENKRNSQRKPLFSSLCQRHVRRPDKYQRGNY